MAKQSGLGDNLYIDGRNISGDTNQIGTIGSPLAVLDFTAIDKSAMERIGGKRDGTIEWTSFFNPGPDVGSGNAAHPTLSALPTADRIISYWRGTVVGQPAASMVAKQINYDGSRDDSGAFTFKVSAQGDGFGLEWGTQLTPGIRTDTAATNGPSVDDGAATNFGLQAYLHVFAFTGTDVTIKLQDSADNVSFADIAGAAFTQVTAAPSGVAQRIAISNAATVRRYVRAISVTTGGFTSCKFAVAYTRNLIAGVVF